MSKGLLNSLIIIPQISGNMTGISVITSLVMDFRTLIAGSISTVWTGTAVGVFSVQGSLDYSVDPSGNEKNTGTWKDLGISLGNPTGVSGSAILDIAMTGIPWLRLQYSNVSGTGTLIAYGHGKGV